METRTMEAKKILRATWMECVSSGDMSEEEMAESLEEQVSGYVDLSLDELSEDIAATMGWDIHDISEEQAEAWHTIVDDTAREWLAGIR